MKKWTILSLIILTATLFSCNSISNKAGTGQSAADSSGTLVLNEQQAEKLDSIVGLILDISAGDFCKNQQPAPVDFENVKLKYIKKANGEELYILCGQFVTNDRQEIPFATIKNTGYEQWVGTSALTYCQNSKEISYTREDLSVALKNKFNSLKN